MRLFWRSVSTLLIPVSAVASAQTPNKGHAPYVTVAYKTEGRHSDILVSEIRPTISATYTYYNALGWTGGYTGLQMTDKGPGFIFSIWDPPGTEGAPSIRSIYSLPGSVVNRFGGEGTGLHYLDTSAKWTLNHWYRFVARCWGTGNVTDFALWTQDEETGAWTHHVTLEAPESSFRFDSWLYSFLEDWYGSGDALRRAEYRWPKVHTLSNQWFSVTQADAHVSPNALVNNPFAKAFDMGMNSDASIFVQTGGDTKTSFTGNSIHLLATGKTASSTSAPNTTPVGIAQATAMLKDRRVTVRWSVSPTTTPQFIYNVQLFDNPEATGTPLAEQMFVAPDTTEAKLDLSASPTKVLYLRLTLVDIFDRQISRIVPVTP